MIKILTIGLFVYVLYRIVFAPPAQISQKKENIQDQPTIDVDYEEVE